MQPGVFMEGLVEDTEPDLEERKDKGGTGQDEGDFDGEDPLTATMSSCVPSINPVPSRAALLIPAFLKPSFHLHPSVPAATSRLQFYSEATPGASTSAWPVQVGKAIGFWPTESSCSLPNALWW